MERQLARHELERDANSPITSQVEDPEREINQLNGEVVRLLRLGHVEQALPFAVQTLADAGERLGEDHVEFAASLNNLAELFRIIGKYAAAEPLYRQALEVRRAALGERDLAVAESLNNLAVLYHATGDCAALSRCSARRWRCAAALWGRPTATSRSA